MSIGLKKCGGRGEMRGKRQRKMKKMIEIDWVAV